MRVKFVFATLVTLLGTLTILASNTIADSETTSNANIVILVGGLVMILIIVGLVYFAVLSSRKRHLFFKARRDLPSSEDPMFLKEHPDLHSPEDFMFLKEHPDLHSIRLGFLDLPEKCTELELTHYSPTKVETLESRDYAALWDQIPPSAKYNFKPIGLWVSADTGNEDGWKDWCQAQKMWPERLAYAYRLTLHRDADVLWLKTVSDMLEFNKKYRSLHCTRVSIRGTDSDRTIDWGHVMAAYQGIIIAPYHDECRSDDDFFWYELWDCASGCIWDLSIIEKWQALKEGDYQSAISAYDEAIRLKPDDAEAYRYRGITKVLMGHPEEAIPDFDEVIRLKPDDAEAYNNRGVAKADLGHYKEAIPDYDIAIRLKPGYAEAYNNRGTTKKLLGHTSEAEMDFQTALNLEKKPKV